MQTKPSSKHRNALPPRCQRGAQDSRELAAAERRRGAQRLVQHAAVPREAAIDDVALARESRLVDAGAASRPARAAATEQRRRDGGRRRRIADAHLAEADQVTLRRHGPIASRHGGEKFVLAHGRLLGEISRRLIERERRNAEGGTHTARQLIDGGAACGKIRHHLCGDFGRIGRYTLPRDAVIAGEDENLDAIEPWWRKALPQRQPGNEVLQPAEAFRRLG